MVAWVTLVCFSFQRFDLLSPFLCSEQNTHTHTLFDYCTAYVCVLVAFLYLCAITSLANVIIIDKIGMIVLGCVRG